MNYKVSVVLSLLMSVGGCIHFVNGQQYPATFSLETLNGTNGFTIPAAIEDSRLGADVSFIGDINDDGLDDICIGAPYVNSNEIERAGAAYVIFGSPGTFSSTFDLNSLNGTNGFIIEGTVADERRGSSLSGLGDVNGDGIDDMIVSGLAAEPMVVYGSSTTFPAIINVGAIDGTNGFIIKKSGVSEVSYAGDINGDGYNEILLGQSSLARKAWVVFGQSGNFPSNINFEWLDGVKGFEISRFEGTIPAYRVGGAGDINNDGYDDIMMGNWASTASEAVSYTLFGKSTPYDPEVDIELVDGTDGFSIGNEGNEFLTFVGTIGDVNGDGIDDCFSENNIIFGSEDPFPSHITMGSLDGTNGFVVSGYTLCSAPAGDLNLDGIDDLMLVGPDRMIYVLFGSNMGFEALFDASTLDGSNGFVIEEIKWNNTGRPIAGNGDFNGDGLSDFLIGEASAIDNSTGRAHLVFGGDHYAGFKDSYPTLTDITTSGFTLGAIAPEAGTVHYAVFSSTFSPVVDQERIRSGTGAIFSGDFAVSSADAIFTEVISALEESTTYDVYLFFEDDINNQSEVHKFDNVATTSNCPYEIPCEERDALIALYNATDGPNWNNHTNWNTLEPVSTWFGVTVSSGHVTSLDVPNNKLSGTLPSQLGSLTALTTLNLAENELSGSVPPSFGSLSSLRYLYLNDNQLSGAIPPSLGNLTASWSINLSDNQLTGTIPTELSNLSDLQILALYRNQLTGSIPAEFGNLKKVTHLYLFDNQLTGAIPSTLGDMAGLRFLNLQNNQLTDNIPSSLTQLSNLEILELQNNRLSGNIPDLTGLSQFDRNFYIYENSFQFGDFEDEFSFYMANPLDFKYSPQAKVDTEISVEKSEGESVTFTVNVNGSANQYQWYHDGVIINGANSSTLSIDNVQADHAGIYHAEVTNTIVTGLTIVRHPIELTVNQAPDTEAPSITCPGDQELACDATVPDYTSLATATDNEDPSPTVTQSPATGSAFTSGMTITLTAEDASGNENTCTFTVNEAADTEDPAVTCPGDRELAPGAMLPDYTSLATVTDNCDSDPEVIQSPLVGSAFTDGMTVTLTATDASGNENTCTFTVNQAPDTEAPSITCPGDQELACDATVPDYTSLATATDNEDPSPTVTQSPAAGAAFGPGMIITLTARDASGNENTCTFTVNEASDTEDPAITCPGDQELAFGATLPDYTSLATVTDICDGDPDIIQSPLPGSAFTDGTTVTLTATDASGNESTCTFTVNPSADTEAPSLTCPGDQELRCSTTLPDYTSLVTAIDDRDASPVITQNPSPGSTFTPGMTITLTATDESGNANTCVFAVHDAEDQAPPTLSCPEETVVTCGEALPDFTSHAEVNDNCDAAPVLTQSPDAGTLITEETLVTLTATDLSGNQSSCTFIVQTEPGFTVDAGSDREIVLGESLNLEAFSVETGDYLWSPEESITGDPTQNPVTVAPLQSTSYRVTLTRADGCAATDEVTVEVIPGEGFKDRYGFSPDGDGINETWEISGLQDYPDNKVSVFNKWGQLVYETRNYHHQVNAFNGTANRLSAWGAGELPEGTYYFTIEFPDGAHERVTGFLVIKR